MSKTQERHLLNRLGRALHNVNTRRLTVHKLEGMVQVQAESPALQAMNEKSLKASQNGLERARRDLSSAGTAYTEWLRDQHRPDQVEPPQ